MSYLLGFRFPGSADNHFTFDVSYMSLQSDHGFLFTYLLNQDTIMLSHPENTDLIVPYLYQLDMVSPMGFYHSMSVHHRCIVMCW